MCSSAVCPAIVNISNTKEVIIRLGEGLNSILLCDLAETKKTYSMGIAPGVVIPPPEMPAHLQSLRYQKTCSTLDASYLRIRRNNIIRESISP
jgi:hypothetical protein